MGDNNLHAASSEWANRPADQRFWTMPDLNRACTESRAGCQVATVPFRALRAEVNPFTGVLMIKGPEGRPAHLTHYAFGQLATAIGAPASYLRELPAKVAAECLNVGLEKTEDRSDRELLFHKGKDVLTLRACLSDKYERVWDNDVTRYLQRLVDDGWRNPAGLAGPKYEGETRTATAEDILPGQINIAPGMTIAPSGLYASDHDAFAFLVAPERTIDDGSGKPLMRGIFVKNSEVGDSSLSFTFFLMQAVCGNHIVWGASGVHEIRIRHVGEAPLMRALADFESELVKYKDGAAEEEAGILAARRFVLGSNKEEVLDALVRYCKAHSIALSRTKLDEGYETAVEHEDWYGDPNTLWAQVAGLTHASQGTGFQDAREATDRAAGKLMRMAF